MGDIKGGGGGLKGKSANPDLYVGKDGKIYRVPHGSSEGTDTGYDEEDIGNLERQSND